MRMVLKRVKYTKGITKAMLWPLYQTRWPLSPRTEGRGRPVDLTGELFETEGAPTKVLRAEQVVLAHLALGGDEHIAEGGWSQRYGICPSDPSG
jgi:hypothetical protein